jgi:FKBP-type peptidyl-prolyl cis-trans isomerase FkpA
MKNLFLFAILSIAMFTSCKDKAEEQLKDDIAIIKKYITDNNLVDAKETSTGLHYIITTPGTGGNPTLSNKVKVKYKGYTTDNAVFDETENGSVADFALSNLIAGWQEGIPLLQKGGKGKFLVPSHIAYGTRGQGDILPNTVLIFDIELVDFY